MGDVEPPAPSPEIVGASRRHLTERYASGVDLLLWETEKRQRWLSRRRALPYATATSQHPEAGKAARRAEAAHRAKGLDTPSA